MQVLTFFFLDVRTDENFANGFLTNGYLGPSAKGQTDSQSAKASKLWNSQSPLVSFWLQKICLRACCSANWISVHQLFLTISCVNINYYIRSKTLCRVTKTSLFCIYTGQQNSWFIQDFKIFLTIILTHLSFDSLAFFRTRSAKWLCKLL